MVVMLRKNNCFNSYKLTVVYQLLYNQCSLTLNDIFCLSIKIEGQRPPESTEPLFSEEQVWCRP